MNTYKHFLLYVIFTLMMISCKKETEILQADTFSKRYYNNTVGAYIIYHTDSLFYNQFTSKIDTFSFDIKEKVVSFFTDDAGRQSQRIERYKLQNNTWQLIRVWKAYVSQKRVEKTEENITYIKLIFPLQKGTEWFGNALNSIDTTTKQKYTCTEIHQPFFNNKLNFDSCTTIQQKSDSTLISKNEAKEIYAINVGLIYKRITLLRDNTSQIDPNKPISKRANSGTDVITYATDFGIE